MGYIPAGEVAAHVSNDPVDSFRAWLIAEGHATEADLAAVDAKAADEVEQTWTFANESAYPDIDELYADVYAL
jgi:pyruvate dehydrogenase E1 component alpha subunit